TTSAIDAITIDVGNGAVILRGLNLVGLGTGEDGIHVQSARAVDIQNCTINGFKFGGINFSPASGASLAISDTIVSGNGSAGISVSAVAGTIVDAFMERVQSLNNTAGYIVSSAGTVRVTAADSVAANNG